MSSCIKINQESHKNAKGKKIKHTNTLDTGQEIVLGHPQGHVSSAEEQTPIPGTGR